MSSPFKTMMWAISSACCAALLSGCGTPVTEVLDPGKVGGGTPLTSTQMMSSYKPTMADPANPGRTITQAQEQGPVEGFGLASATQTAATTTVGTYAIGKVDRSEPGKVKIEFGGQSYTMNRNGLTGGRNIGGKNYAYHGFGNTMGNPAAGQNGAILMNSDYVSVAAFVKGGGAWQQPIPSKDQWVVPGADGYGLLVTGLETPGANMPKNQTAMYNGQYVFGVKDGSDVIIGPDGFVSMNVDFNTNKITGFARSFDHPAPHTLVNAEIVNQNQFAGKVSRGPNNPTGMNGDIAGAFFGPNAEQMAGAGVGKGIITDFSSCTNPNNPGTCKTKEVDMGGIFLANRQNNP